MGDGPVVVVGGTGVVWVMPGEGAGRGGDRGHRQALGVVIRILGATGILASTVAGVFGIAFSS